VASATTPTAYTTKSHLPAAFENNKQSANEVLSTTSVQSAESDHRIAQRSRPIAQFGTQADISMRHEECHAQQPAVVSKAALTQEVLAPGDSLGDLDIDRIRNPFSYKSECPDEQPKLARIKSIGRAPRFRTPEPTPTLGASPAMHCGVETPEIPPLDVTLKPVTDRKQKPSLSRSDSGVLGQEDAACLRRSVASKV